VIGSNYESIIAYFGEKFKRLFVFYRWYRWPRIASANRLRTNRMATRKIIIENDI